MGGNWVVQEGYLLVKPDGGAPASPTAALLHRSALVERFFVLSMNRRMEIYESSAKERRVDACVVRAFCGWDGQGLLKAGDAYGLELKLDKSARARMFVAAFNRLDLEKWCRGFLAVLDPESAAGQEVRRERRKLRKEEKRLQEEKEEKIRQWKEQQKKMIEEEKQRLQAREEEILNMTPLERIDGLGSLDDDTARLLEKRKQRLQRRQAPTTRRVNKAAYRQRMEEAAGGKLDNVQPLQTRTVEQRSKVRVEPPPPGQFIEASRSGRRNSNPARHRPLDSSGSDSDNSFISGESKVSSGQSSSSRGQFSNGSSVGGIPPPPPPPPPPRFSFEDSRLDFIPPPPPPPPMSARRQSTPASRANSVQSAVDDASEQYLENSRGSRSESIRRKSGIDRDKQTAQDSLAAILGRRKMPGQAQAIIHRRDSFESTSESVTSGSNGRTSTRKQKLETQPVEPSVTNAFAASLAAIRRNRAETADDEVDDADVDAQHENQRVRERTRKSQLSAEGKALLQKAIGGMDSAVSAKQSTRGGRKGLFDESSEDDESDSGLFGVARMERNGAGRPVKASTPASKRSASVASGGFSDDSDDDDDVDTNFFRRPPSETTSPRSILSTQVTASRPAVDDVIYKSCVVQNQGKKSIGVYTFAFRKGPVEHSFSHSYHELEEIHERLSSEVASLPKFPSKHWMRNNTKPENMQKRAMEFVQYFKELVAIPSIFTNKRFLFEFQVRDDFLAGSKPTTRTPVAAAPKASRTPTSLPNHSGHGGVSRASALFGAEDTDSEPDSASVASVETPRRPPTIPELAQPIPDSQPKRKKKSKLSKKSVGNGESDTTRSEKTRSRGSVRSGLGEMTPPTKSNAVDDPVPKITGLPARPNLFGGGRGDLLAAIRQGAALKKTMDSAEAAPNPPVGRGAGSRSHVSLPQPPAPLNPTGSIGEAITNAMAARRIHVEYEDDKEEDSDDDWD